MPVINYGDTASGTLSISSVHATARPGSFCEKYTFVAAQYDTISIHEVSTDFDCYLFLMDTDAITVLASNDDSPISGDGSNSYLTYLILTAGTYTIEASTYDSAAVGDFTLELLNHGAILDDTFSGVNGTGLDASNHHPDFSVVNNLTYVVLDGTDIDFTSGTLVSPDSTEVCADFSVIYNAGVSSLSGGIPLNAEYAVLCDLTVTATPDERHDFQVWYAYGKQNDLTLAYGRVTYGLLDGVWTVDRATTLGGSYTSVATVTSPLAAGLHAIKIEVRETGLTIKADDVTILSVLAADDPYLPFGLVATGMSGPYNNVAFGWYDAADVLVTYTYTDAFDGIAGSLDTHLTDEGTGWHTTRADNYLLNGIGQLEANPAHILGTHPGYILDASPGWCADQTDVSLQFAAPAPEDGVICYDGVVFSLGCGSGFTGFIVYDNVNGWRAILNVNNITVFTSAELASPTSPSPTSMRIDTRSNRVKMYVDSVLLYNQTYLVAGDPGDTNGFVSPAGFSMTINLPQCVDAGDPDQTLIHIDGFSASTGSRTSVAGVALTRLRILIPLEEDAMSTSPPCGFADPMLWLFATTRDIGRVQEGVTRDMQIGTDLTTGEAIAPWTYSTGFEFTPSKARVRKVFLDTTGPVQVTLHTDTDDRLGRSKNFAEGEHEHPIAGDLAAYKFRVRLTGVDSSVVKRLLWERTPVEGEGAPSNA